MFIMLNVMLIRLEIYINSILDKPMFIWIIIFVFSLYISYCVYLSSKARAFTLIIMFVYDFTLHIFDYLFRCSFH